MKRTILILAAFFIALTSWAACTPLGDQTTYGTNNVWIGYVYTGNAFNTYSGYVTEGISSNPNFDESFGGASVSYNTNGCPITTDNFSVRYKLTQNFSNGDYAIFTGGDDGFRLSIDGGSTWLVNQWNAQSYFTNTTTVHLNGTYNLVLEFFENTGDNRITFNITKTCTATSDPTVYGANNKWIGYIYGGQSFNAYKGYISEGTTASSNFDEGFGGDVVTLNTSECSQVTTQFSARFRLAQTFTPGTYQITVGGDDGYRLSLDGGSSWVINNWGDHGYTTTTYSATLSGVYNMVLEYYENAGGNRVTYSVTGGTILPVSLTGFKGTLLDNNQVKLSWTSLAENDINAYQIQRSADGANFTTLAVLNSRARAGGADTSINYVYTDASPVSGNSWYRILAIGKDNYTNVTPVAAISNRITGNTRMYPTVVRNNQLFVEAAAPMHNARVEFFDMSGKKIGENVWETLSGRQVASLSSRAGLLPSGSYLARLTASGKPVLQQIVLVAAR